MKYIFLFISIFCGFIGFAQNTNSCKLKLKLIDQYNYPLAFCDFWMIDQETKSQITEKTNEYGNAELLLDANKSYTFNYTGTPDYMQIDILHLILPQTHRIQFF